jgi:hypothetical protein
MILLTKIFLFGVGLYGVLLAINAACLPNGWRTNWIEIACCLFCVLLFAALCVVL